VIGLVSAGVFALSLMLLMPAQAPASKSMPSRPALKNLPLEANGCLITAQIEEQIDVGQSPSLQLTIRNTSAEPAEFDLNAVEMCTNNNPMSRAISMPRKSWQTHRPISLKPGQSKVITLVSTSKARPWDSFHFVISAGDESIRTTQLGVKAEPAQSPQAVSSNDA